MVNQVTRKKRHARIRSKISGTASRPRLCVYRSLTSIYAQLIDDENNKVLAQTSDLKAKTNPKLDSAKVVGKAIAEAAKKIKVAECVFDRNGYKFHGRVKALAESARENGLKF
jgi:large subunit ribosomal protein L18